jgi:hypothetical protein
MSVLRAAKLPLQRGIAECERQDTPASWGF